MSCVPVRNCAVPFALILVVLGLSGAASAADAPPNIVLLVSDDQRPDTIAALGNRHIRTPHLDRLVREGTAFTRAIAANPICTPSRAELMTGATGFHNGVLDFGTKIDADQPLLAATLKKAGYRTWYVGKWHNDGRPTTRGYDATRRLFGGGGGKWAVETRDWAGRIVTGYRGWVFQDDDGTKHPEQGVGLTPDISETFADAAIDIIRESNQPYFLHVNFTAPHDPLLLPHGWEEAYAAKDIPLPANFRPEHPFDHGNLRGRDELLFTFPRTEEETRAELAAYYAVISHLDAQVGRILDALDDSKQAKNTIVIFTSDHGLAVGSHGLRGKQNMYEHTIGVPLVMRGPGIPRDRRIDAQCTLRDLFPTCCDWAGLETPDRVDGRSLTPLLTGEKSKLHDAVFGYFRDSQRMIRTDDWKLIRYPQADRWQLFHLKTDPHELHDLSKKPEHADQFARLQQRLAAWRTEQGDTSSK